jgi:hypothetical protein
LQWQYLPENSSGVDPSRLGWSFGRINTKLRANLGVAF